MFKVNNNQFLIFKTIFVGSIGGILFNIMLLPLPWMLGPAFMVGMMALSGLKVSVNQKFRNPFIGIIGVWLGSYFSSNIIEALYEWSISLIFLLIFIPFSHLISYIVLIYFRRLKKPEAFFIGSPGGLLEMTLGAEECGANSKKVSLVHIFRIFLTVMIVPNILLLLFPGAFSREAIWPDFGGEIFHVFVFFIIIPIGMFLGNKINLPGNRLFGPLILSAIIHLLGIFKLDANISILIIAQLIIGSFLGSNMSGISWKTALNYIIDAMIVIFCLILSFIPFVYILDKISNIRTEALILAFSPGGVNEMGLVAAFLNIEPAYVITHHLARLCTILILLIFAKKYLYEKFKTINNFKSDK